MEFYSAVYRRMREGRLTEQDVQNLTLVFTAHKRQNYNVVRLTNPILAQAQSLIKRYPLRAYDSIQLASALNIAFRVDEPLTFVCADVRLLTVAEAEGLVSLNPNDHE